MKHAMNKIPRIGAGLLVGLLTALPALADLKVEYEVGKIEPEAQHAATARNVVKALERRHYVEHEFDDQFSSRVFDAWLDDLDATRSYLLAADVSMFEVYRFLLDDALRNGDLAPAYKMFNRYQQRVVERFEYCIALLEAGIGQFDFSVDETLDLERKAMPWPSSTAELDDLWRRRIKNAVLSLRLTDKEEEEIEELLIKRYRNRLARAMQTNSDDVFQLYMNSFASTYDPHTQYFSPRTSENFNINMSLSLEGIGAVLRVEDEYTSVVSLVQGGPAKESGQLHPNDRIVGVGQGVDGEIVDVIGWRLDDVVDLIRGKKDSIVRLDILPAAQGEAAVHQVIQLTRNKVKLEEQSAKSEVIEVERFGHVYRVGVIDLPTFYADFRALQKGDPNYKSTTRDVSRLLVELQQGEGIDALIIDLRDNVGGSLDEVNALTGLFIDSGPTVQVRGKGNRVDVLVDRDKRTFYDGPLAVLVNRQSASASEIFAGAIQDYQRGIIMGTQTFGKGTVQSLIPLDRGQMKMTLAKFYRISGDSTQHTGVIPDIIFPARYNADEIGESSLDDPLPWDEIRPTIFNAGSSLGEILPVLQEQHFHRVKDDAEFAYLHESMSYRRERGEETVVSLNEKQRRADKEEADTFWLALENRRRLAKGLPAVASLDELNDPDEPTVAAAGSGATGITLEGVDGTAEGDAAADVSGATASLGGSEVTAAGADEGDAAAVQADTAMSETDSATESAEEDSEDDEPDALLVESGNILVDWIRVGQRTADQASTAATP